MAYTQEDITAITNAVIATLRTNGRNINQLSPVAGVNPTDYIELDGGRRVALEILNQALLEDSKEFTTSQISDLKPELHRRYMLLATYVDTSTGTILRWKLPDKILYYDDTQRLESIFDSQFAERRESIRDLSLIPLFNAAMSASSATQWPSVDERQANYATPQVNGYYPDLNPDAPYYVAGVWLTQAEMLRVLLDRYTPYMGGVQCSAKVNLPVFVKTSDSSLTLDYAATNNGNPVAVVLGSAGWATSVRPTSMKRAFDGCSNLKAVIGEIDMSIIASAWDANSLFRNCPNLWQFRLANIPDAIETLDLSGVSDAILTPWAATSGTPKISTLKYIADNFARDITRSKQLTIKVSPAVFARIADDLMYSKAGITWASA